MSDARIKLFPRRLLTLTREWDGTRVSSMILIVFPNVTGDGYHFQP